MIKSMRFVALIALAFSTFSGLAYAQKGTNTRTASTNLNIQVNVVEVVMTNQNLKTAPETTAVSYSIPTIQPRMSVTKAVRKMQATDGKTSGMVEITTIVAE